MAVVRRRGVRLFDGVDSAVEMEGDPHLGWASELLPWRGDGDGVREVMVVEVVLFAWIILLVVVIDTAKAGDGG